MYSMRLSYCDSVQVLEYKVNNNSKNNWIYCSYNSKKLFITPESEAYKDHLQTFMSAHEGRRPDV